jgi:predicted alpha/beta superfamily hydrolase
MKEYNVLIVYSEELKREVKVFISLPKDYAEVEQYYPVLYLNAGQALFNDFDQYMGQSWGIMEGYMNNPAMPKLVLIGIVNEETSTNELLPFSFESPQGGQRLGGQTKDYMDFIVHSLKPIINAKYRVFQSPEKTGMLGISIGGVCTTYAASKYSDHFTLFGCLSSCFPPVFKEMVNLAKECDYTKVQKMYMDIGTNEVPGNLAASKSYLDTNQEMYDILKEKIDPEKLQYQIIQDGTHDIPDWSKRFPIIIEYLYGQFS